MLVSNGSGAILAAGLSHVLKQWWSVQRPDKSDHRSFPSGHTTMAFATAAMLEEEYGHISPWITIGGYSLTTLTAMTRITNHRHWTSDVIGGFTLGTTSTMAGYMIGDLILKGKGVELEELPFVLNTKTEKPHYLGIYSAAVLTPGHYSLGNGKQLSFKTGFSSGIEGAFFSHPNIGFGGRIGVIDLLPKLNRNPMCFSVNYLNTEAGFFLSFPVGHRTLLGGRVLGGKYWLTTGKNDLRKNNIGLNDLYSTSVGLSLDMRTRKHLSVRFFGDYGLLFHSSHQQTLNIGISTIYRL